MSYKKTAINELAKTLLNEGFRVFIAKSGTYGFYTNDEGSSVVSFQYDRFSGNHTPINPQHGKYVGSGWGFIETQSHQSMLSAVTPSWATNNGDYPCKNVTLEEHLSRYGKSSQYNEINSLQTK